MIERFNFYDLYGYLLPGAALIAVFFWPFLLTGTPRPTLEWSSALGSLILSYIAGHLLQILARRAFGETPHPSDQLLIDARRGFVEPFRTELIKLIADDFRLNARVKEQRQLAFQMCRSAIQSKEQPSYAEQFQGLYALMRGLAAVSVIGGIFHAGWFLQASASRWPAASSIAAAFALFGLLMWSFGRGSWFWFFATLALVVGIRSGLGRQTSQTAVQLLALSSTGLLVASRLFFESFRFFQWEFARSVYITFYTRRRIAASSPAKAHPPFE